MPEDGRNIYKTCRELAGYTQEHAAELLGCSVRALARYEGGEAFPSRTTSLSVWTRFTPTTFSPVTTVARPPR
ncbi:helix-turn-helix transcriptional regulator [Oscillibacter sp. CU971]|uniref:helix-turn-helix domain-containing protein n=1 Tax=Oscillibacter sp. CU971 TaxID=2780102 RepID=UPI00195CD092